MRNLLLSDLASCIERKIVRSLAQSYRYAIAYKPYDVLSANRDRHGRPTLAQLGVPYELHPAGRLDLDSEGLLLLTDDGHLAHRITHPDFNHPKTYLVLVLGHPDESALQQLREGVEIKFGVTRPAGAEVLCKSAVAARFSQAARITGEDDVAADDVVRREKSVRSSG